MLPGIKRAQPGFCDAGDHGDDGDGEPGDDDKEGDVMMVMV